MGFAEVRLHQRYLPNQNVGAAKDTTEGLETELRLDFQRQATLAKMGAGRAPSVPEVEALMWLPGNSAWQDRRVLALRPLGVLRARQSRMAPAVIIRWLAVLRGRSVLQGLEAAVCGLRPGSWVQEVPSVAEAR